MKNENNFQIGDIISCMYEHTSYMPSYFLVSNIDNYTIFLTSLDDNTSNEPYPIDFINKSKNWKKVS